MMNYLLIMAIFFLIVVASTDAQCHYSSCTELSLTQNNKYVDWIQTRLRLKHESKLQTKMFFFTTILKFCIHRWILVFPAEARLLKHFWTVYKEHIFLKASFSLLIQSQKPSDNLSGPSLKYHEVFAIAIAISLKQKSPLEFQIQSWNIWKAMSISRSMHKAMVYKTCQITTSKDVKLWWLSYFIRYANGCAFKLTVFFCSLVKYTDSSWMCYYIEDNAD